MWNLQIEWEDGTTTYEPMSVIADTDPFTVAEYAQQNNLLDKPGFKRL